MSTADGGSPLLDVVICTYDHAASLDRALAHLAAQESPDEVDWRVLVVDNNCTDDTAERVERHRRQGRIPGLRRVVETTQGLTPARLAGVRETDAPWIAYVDDDCMLATNWIASACAFIVSAPACGGFGGRVELALERPLPAPLQRFGTLFAEQDHGPGDREVTSLAGAGFVVSRRALERSGWIEHQVLDDRVGRRLISGGDIEIGLRVRAAGAPLWYVGSCRLRHVIEASRTEPRYLARLTAGLGAASVLADSLTAPADGWDWARGAARTALRQTRLALKSAAGVTVRRTAPQAAALRIAWAIGSWRGCRQLVRMGSARRGRLIGVAAPVPPLRWEL